MVETMMHADGVAERRETAQETVARLRADEARLHALTVEVLKENVVSMTGPFASIRRLPGFGQEIVGQFLDFLQEGLNPKALQTQLRYWVQRGLGPEAAVAVVDALYAAGAEQDGDGTLRPTLDLYRRQFILGYEVGRRAEILAEHEKMQRGLYGALEKQIASERQARGALQRRQSQLQLVADLARVTTSTRDLNELMSATVRRLQESFGLAFVGIFLVDEFGQWMVLRGGAGEPGAPLLAQGYQIKLDVHSPASQALKGHAPIFLREGKHATERFVEPLLPTSALTVVMPLSPRGQDLGLLTMHSADETYFTEQDAPILTVIADNLAYAIENAELFTRSQTSLAELERAQRTYVRESWTRGESETDLIYTQKEDAFAPVNGDAPKAAESVAEGETGETLSVPITLRGEVIGTVDLMDVTQTRLWNEEEKALAVSVVEQMALAVENARLFEEAQRRSQETAVINELARELSGELDEDKLFGKVYEYLPRLMPTDAFVVWLYDDATGMTTRRVLFDLGVRYPRDMTPTPMTERLTAVVEGNVPLAINWSRAEWEEERAKVESIFGSSEPSASLLYVPLRIGNRVRGVMSAQTYQFNAYGEPQVALLTSVANQIATALENAELFAETREALSESQTLYEVSARLNAANDLQETLEAAAFIALEAGAHMAALFETNLGGDGRPASLSLQASAGPGAARAIPVATVIPIGESAFTNEWTLNPTAPVFVNDLENDSRVTDSERGSFRLSYVKATAILPLFVAGRWVGMLGLNWPAPHEFSEREKRLYSAIMVQATTVLDNRRLFEQTREALAETQTLYEISARLNSARTMQESLEAAAGPAIVQGAFSAFLMRVDADEAGKPRGLELAAVWPRNSGLIGANDERLPVGLLGDHSGAENSHEPMMVEDVREDARLGEDAKAFYGGRGIQATALLPIRVGTRWLAVLSMNWQTPHGFSARDARLFRSTMTQAATVLDNRRLFEETQQALGQTQTALIQVQEAQERLNLQYQTANILARATSFEDAAARLLENTCRSLNWQIGEYWAIDEQTDRLTLAHAWCEDDERLGEFSNASRGVSYARGVGLAGKAWEAGTPIWIADTSTEPMFQSSGLAQRAHLVSALAFPLQSETHQFGVTVFFTTHAQEMDDAVLTTMVGVGNQIGQFQERRRAEEAMRQQNTYLTALHDTTLGLMSRLDVNELLQIIITRAGELLGTEHGYVHLIEPSGAELRMRVGIGIYQDFVGSRVKRGQGLAGTIWRDQKPIVVDDYRYWSGRLPMVDRDVLRAVVGVPLKSGNQTVGVLGLASLEEGRRFGAAQIDALNRFAELAAVALDNAQLYNATQQNIKELSLVNQISLEISQGTQVADVSSRVVNALTRALHIGTALVSLYDRAREQIYVPAAVYHGEPAEVKTFAFGKGFASHVIRTRQPLLLNGDVARAAAEMGAVAFEEQESASCYAAVPILDETGQGMGMLAVEDHAREGTFDEATIRLLSTLAANLSVAIQRARLNEQTRMALAQTQRLAERERTTAEITDKLYAAPDVQSVLRTAAEELRKSTGSRRAVVRLRTETNGKESGSLG